MNGTGLGAIGAVLHGSAFDWRDLGRYADDHTGTHPGTQVLVRFLDEVGHHFFCSIKIGDHSILDWTYRAEMRRRPSQHFACAGPNGFDGPIRGVEGDE